MSFTYNFLIKLKGNEPLKGELDLMGSDDFIKVDEKFLIQLSLKQIGKIQQLLRSVRNLCKATTSIEMVTFKRKMSDPIEESS
jgi:hypothetical protein